MKAFLEKNKKQRSIFRQKEKQRFILKYLCSNRILNLKKRCALHFFFQDFSFISFVRIKNCCVKCFYTRSVLRYFRLSRFKFRNVASNGKIFGLIKASW